MSCRHSVLLLVSLRSSRILREVHPWLRVRLEWLGEVAKIIGSGQSLISGNRTRDEQQILFDLPRTRPAAAPGCSQHQYGFAADATYLPSVLITSKARPLLSAAAETNRVMKDAAHHVNLTTVSNDPGHLQVYPGAQFRDWAIGRGLCNPLQAQGFNILEVQRSNDVYRDCLLNAVRLNSEGFRGSLTCSRPCGPLFNIPC